jgi:hypothetical protein
VSEPLTLTFPDELVEAIAERAAAILAERSPAENGSPWFNVPRASEYLAVSTQRVYDLKSAGRLPASGNDGDRRPRFHRRVLDAYLMGGPDAAKNAAESVAAQLPRELEHA